MIPLKIISFIQKRNISDAQIQGIIEKPAQWCWMNHVLLHFDTWWKILIILMILLVSIFHIVGTLRCLKKTCQKALQHGWPSPIIMYHKTGTVHDGGWTCPSPASVVGVVQPVLAPSWVPDSRSISGANIRFCGSLVKRAKNINH